MSTNTKLSDQAPKVENLKTLLSYQEQAIVSRMLVKNTGGNVTLFAFDGGEGLSEHTAPYDALIVGVDGEADIMLGGQHHDVGEGQTLLMPANVPHAVHPKGQFKMLLCFFIEFQYGSFADFQQVPGLYSSPAQDKLQRHFGFTSDLSCRPDPAAENPRDIKVR